MTVRVTTDPDGGPGAGRLSPGENTVYLYADGTGKVEFFIFDWAPSGPDLTVSDESLGPAFGGQPLTSDTVFGWVGFFDAVPFTDRILLASLTVTVAPGAQGDQAKLDLTGPDWQVGVNGDEVLSSAEAGAGLVLPGPSADSPPSDGGTGEPDDGAVGSPPPQDEPPAPSTSDPGSGSTDANGDSQTAVTDTTDDVVTTEPPSAPDAAQSTPDPAETAATNDEPGGAPCGLCGVGCGQMALWSFLGLLAMQFIQRRRAC